jgi:hypothetical protein
MKTLELANFLCKIRFLKDLDIKIFKTKNLDMDNWLSWTVASAIIPEWGCGRQGWMSQRV